MSGFMRGAASAALVSVVLGLSAMAATAATVTCGGVASATNRVFSLDTSPSAGCFAVGNGNLSGSSNGAKPDPLFGLLTTSFGTGFSLIDKSDDSTSGAGPNALTALSGSLTGGLSGVFSFLLPAAPVGKMWTNIVIAFKSGQGRNINNDWAAFLLPAGVTSGSWSISGQQALSHANLYGQLVDAPAPVPLPAAGLVLIAGLGALGTVRRRRKA
jgi:hypothetical protein